VPPKPLPKPPRPKAHGDAATEGAAATEAHADTAGSCGRDCRSPAARGAGDAALHARGTGRIEARLDAAKVEKAEHAPNTMINAAHLVPTWVKVSPFVAMLIGFGLAWLFYIKDPSLPRRLAAQQRPLYLFLLNKWYFDELYD
jgi:NADH-quinone oxidoreductase subunit L